MRKLLLILSLSMLSTANAELHDRGGGFIYDDVLDVTWTQDAGLFIGDWYDAVEWVESLELYDSVRDTTWDNWRLATGNADGIGFVPADCAVVSEVECRDNELGYLFHHYGIGPSYSAPFTNMSSFYDTYWDGDDTFPSNGLEQNFVHHFNNGTYFVYFFPAVLAAWAVRDGDVAQGVAAEARVVQPPQIHPHHDGSPAVAGLNDTIEVVVLGSSTNVSDPVDFNPQNIDTATLRFGPGGAVVNPEADPPLYGIDYDNDGIYDAGFEFLTGDSGIGCGSTE
ncbi:MAG: hypothetical protein ACR2P6_09925, partial [Gammaproteobacteria bacterium]